MGVFTGVTSLDMDLGATVSLTVNGTDGPDDVTLGAGSVDADLGTGADRVRLDRFHTRPASGRIDFGSGKDELSVDSLTPFSLDLRTGTTGGLGVLGLESSAIAAPKVLYRGSSHRDTVQAIGCRVVLRGGGGNDILAYANEDVRPSTPKCHGYRFRIFGQAGNDQMTGWRGRDLLLGGPGRDHANGKQDVDTCRAEVRVQCER
jgi:Ca2+-binding RTX toxin-like protein